MLHLLLAKVVVLQHLLLAKIVAPLRDAKTPALVTQDLEDLLDHQDLQHAILHLKWDQEAHLVIN